MTSPVINPFSTLATDPLRNFRFLVQFNPHETDSTQSGVTYDASVGFVQVSGLTVQTESIQYREGGYNTTVHQIPGMTVFTPLTFTRGQVLGSSQNWDWMKQLFAVTSGSSVSRPGTDFRCNIDIAVLSHPNPSASVSSTGDRAKNPWNMHKALRFRVYNAWITSMAFGDLSAGDNALMVEQMTVVHEGFNVHYASNYSASAPSFT